jgi:hypothetical protein
MVRAARPDHSRSKIGRTLSCDFQNRKPGALFEKPPRLWCVMSAETVSGKLRGCTLLGDPFGATRGARGRIVWVRKLTFSNVSLSDQESIFRDSRSVPHARNAPSPLERKAKWPIMLFHSPERGTRQCSKVGFPLRIK